MATYIFNPDNDLALAAFDANYTPPASARKMAADLAVLPMWYANQGSTILVSDAHNHIFFQKMQTLFPERLSTTRLVENLEDSTDEIKPWGWNPALHKQLITSGATETLLPAIADMRRLRTYSNRRNAVKMLAELQQLHPEFCGESYLFSTLEPLLIFLENTANKGNVFLKMPLSGSGKGIIRIIDAITDKQTDWCKRVMDKQGAIVAESVLNKVHDFAMEFSIVQGVVFFLGYSLFETSSAGAYTGNLLLSDKEIMHRLGKYISVDLLSWIKAQYLRRLPEYFPEYEGVLGVDMMICRNATHGFSLQPCVEINMRMNMGLAAHCFRENFMCEEARGRFVLDFFKKNGAADAFHQNMTASYPLRIENERIVGGYLALNPLDETTRYLAYAVVE